MESKRYNPLIDKFYYVFATITFAIVASPVLICGIVAPTTLFITIPILLFSLYFLITPLTGFVELRESTLYIRYGFIMTKEIAYTKIRSIEKDRTAISPSLVSLKNALEHVNIKFNTFDITTVSVKDNDSFIEELKKRCAIAHKSEK